MTDTLIAPSGVELGRRPPGMGRVFFCDLFNGSDTNNGLSPDTPFSTIAYALTQCVARRGDYIYVIDGWNEATPISVNIARVHIIGIGAPNLPFVMMTEDGGGDAIFVMANTEADYAEIAGFDLGGGNASGGIEATVGGDATDRVWIHHCTFGSEHCGDTALNGILLSAAMTARGWLIEDCKFIGVNGVTGGTLTGSGIVIGGGVHHTVKNCEFELCVLPAIDLAGFANTIRNNVFSLPADAAPGGAIRTAAAGVGNCLIDGNCAMEGAETAMAQNPFLEQSADANHWGRNYSTLAGGEGMEIRPA